MNASSSKAGELVRQVPVLKMPPELALPALRVLATTRSLEDRCNKLVALRPTVPTRTLLNAYVLPSLTDLRLYTGTLRSGKPTRFGALVAGASDTEGHSLMSKHLLGVDEERVGFVGWLLDRATAGIAKRIATQRFAEEKLGMGNSDIPALLDRLGKWAAYLVYFDVVRERQGERGRGVWSVNRRHLEAIRASSQRAGEPPKEVRAEALLDAYAKASQQHGTRLYIPIEALRDEVGRVLRIAGFTLPDSQLNDILREAPALLTDYVVSFSPFSGPSRGGLKLENMYAGFISIRPVATNR